MRIILAKRVWLYASRLPILILQGAVRVHAMSSLAKIGDRDRRIREHDRPVATLKKRPTGALDEGSRVGHLYYLAKPGTPSFDAKTQLI
jgi:hypothetical protein